MQDTIYLRFLLTYLQASRLALLTLVFPDTTSNGLSVTPPNPSQIPLLHNSTANLLPSSKNILTPISQEKTLAISVPYTSAPQFVQAIRELPCSQLGKIKDAYGNTVDQKRWMMSAVKGDTAGPQRSFTRRVSDAWTAFVDLLKVCLFFGPPYVDISDTYTMLYRTPRSLTL